MALCLLPAGALAEGAEVVTIEGPHSVEDLNVKWMTLEPVHTEGSPYISPPEMSYFDEIGTLGQVQGQVLTDGLNTLNFARYMAGLTGDVSTLYEFTLSAQYASSLLAVMDNGQQPHAPKARRRQPVFFMSRAMRAPQTAT